VLAVKRAGYTVRSVSSGFDGGGDGAAECGVWTKVVFSTDEPPRRVYSKVAMAEGRVLAVAAVPPISLHEVVVISTDIASSGKDAWLDPRCGGAVAEQG